jgi:hypothetical protein
MLGLESGDPAAMEVMDVSFSFFLIILLGFIKHELY